MNMLQNENNFGNYLGLISQLKNHVVIIAVRDTIVPSSTRTTITDGEYGKLENLGLKLIRKDNIADQFWSGYAAVISDGKVVYENLSTRGEDVRYEGEQGGIRIQILSSPYKNQNAASIIVNGTECALNERGFNFVIIHSEDASIADAVTFDTWNAEKQGFRKEKQRSVSVNAATKQKDHYDVGIMGVWTGCNYGSIATYYALNRIIEKMGYSVLMIDKPRIMKEGDAEMQMTHSRIFANQHYNISKSYKVSELAELNKYCDTFVMGSDQVWNYGISKNFGKSYYLDFVLPGKKKVAYAASFGHGKDFAPPEERKIISGLMKDFDAISVRESDGVRICRDIYDVKATQVIDPVFLADREIFDELAKESFFKEEEPYIATYILDPTPEKVQLMQNVSQRLGCKLINILDGLPWLFEQNKKKLGLEVVENVHVEDWISIISKCRFLITDSVHGTSIGLLYNRPFIALKNGHRGVSRFNSLSSLFNIKDRVLTNPLHGIDEDYLLKDIDYSTINVKLLSEKKRCYEWLQSVLNLPPKKLPSVMLNNYNKEKLYTDPDFIKIRILATLFRDYGVKHIVLSPGGRDVPLVRMFEYNEGTFALHRVTDERSAAYYGLGIAAQLRQPVACICTSGTAASNYLPAVTEAYYTGIPLIMVTADRQEVYHNQGEDQTIPQKHIYDNVVKKSITIPEGNGYKVEYQTRRDISDCILETTHRGFGPVHINIAIDNTTIGENVPREYWKLPQKIYPHILRVGFNDEESKLKNYVSALKKSHRILLVYGQNPPVDDKHKKDIENFAKKYNCVIVTDHISNLKCVYSLKPYNMLQAMTNTEFNEKLSPDILITVGGKRLMNDPLTFKIRHGLKNIRHWSVTPDGKIKDFYFRLTSVIEMSQEKFFEWFTVNAGNIVNDGIYYEKWRELTVKYTAPQISEFNSNYIQSKFLPKIPSNSILHLGVGQSFYDCRKYTIPQSVEVYCNMGTNGIDGCTSTFMGQCAVVKNKLCFLLVGDLSFFYDMNSIWNKPLDKNIRILMVNNNGSGLLKRNNLRGITSVHNTSAKGWVESTGFKYISAKTDVEFNKMLDYFISDKPESPLFFEVFCK